MRFLDELCFSSKRRERAPGISSFYETRQAGMGASYLLEFESVTAVVCSHPHRYPIEAQPEIRRVRLKQFPYNILFRETGNTIQVLAVAHKRRNPRYWQNRL